MENKKIISAGIILLVSLVVALSAYGVWRILAVPPLSAPPPLVRYDLGGHAEFVRLDSPVPGKGFMSPLTVSGQARLWYFEASFPIELKDGNGKILAVAPAQAQGDWMTEDFVPFKAILVFPKPETASGTLTLKKDNPSGLPEFDDQVSVPVQFKLSDPSW